MPADTLASSYRAVPTSELDAVLEACLDDALGAFGVAATRHRYRARLLRMLLRARVGRLARQMLIYDTIVGERGLQAGSAYALRTLVRHAEAHGNARVPRHGPLLLVSNHPGLADAVALFAHTPRDDLRAIAARRPLLAALPETARHLFFVPEYATDRQALVRRAARHMRRGGALVTYPGGRIEPDPAICPNAASALDGWSDSVDVLARLVPGLTIVPVIVSGVLSRRALGHPLTRLRRSRDDREWLAATLQLLVPALGDVTTTVAFGAPVRVGGLASDGTAQARVLAEARRLIDAAAAERTPGG